MKLFYYDLNLCFGLERGKLNSLVFESPQVFERVLIGFEQHLHKEAEPFALYEAENAVNLTKCGDMIISPFDLRYDKREQQRKLYSQLETLAEESDAAILIAEAYGKVIEILDALFFESEYEIEHKEELVLHELFKDLEVHIKNPEGRFIEKLVAYLTTVKQLLNKDFFIIANCDAYLEREDYCFLQECARYYSLCIVFLRNRQCGLKIEENEYIIDCDLCEIH